MRKPALIFLAAILCVSTLAFAKAPAVRPPGPVIATIDATQAGRPISRYEYGMFIEHIGAAGRGEPD